MAEKIDKKELKQPDAFQRAGLEAKSWIEGKEKLVLGAVAAVLVAAAVAALVDYFSDRGERQAQKALGVALTPVMRPVADANSPPPPADAPESEKPFPSLKEKDEAVVASLTQFRQAHPGTTSATTAALPLAQSYYRLGKLDEALQMYGEFLKGADKNDPLRAVALEGQGYVHEAKGQFDQAIAAFEEMDKQPKDEFLDGMGQFHKARVLILQGKKEEAAKVLADVQSAHPNSAAARMATERMNVLASQGVAIPTPSPAPAQPPAANAETGKGS